MAKVEKKYKAKDVFNATQVDLDERLDDLNKRLTNLEKLLNKHLSNIEKDLENVIENNKEKITEIIYDKIRYY